MKNIVIILSLCIFSLTSCVKEDHFGHSNRAQIKSFVIEGQSGNTIINNDSLTIIVTVPETTTDFILIPIEISVSNFATISPSVNQVQDFKTPVSYSVTAENGTIKIYDVYVQRGGSQPQLDNSSFEDWYMQSVGLSTVEQPGLDAASTIWGTANRGLGIVGAAANTTKQTNGDSFYVKMESVAAPALVRIAAGSIFIGVFKKSGIPSVTDPRSNIELGTPFTARPIEFSFEYTYQAGLNNQDDAGNPLPYDDQCDIYLLLENRDGPQVKRVGTAWFRSGDNVSNWMQKSIPIKYGPLDVSDPWYSYAQPLQDEVWGDAADPVTHITVLASSSFEGDLFNGAIGSSLELDNIVLGY